MLHTTTNCGLQDFVVERLASLVFFGDTLLGDNHIFVVEAAA